MALVKKEQQNFTGENLVMIISGLPGTGKTTLAFSAPDVALIDFDKGVKRTNPAHRKDIVTVSDLEALETDLSSPEMSAYKTIVFDTAGQFIEVLKDWAVRTVKGAEKNGGGISLQGFGVVKSKFIEFTNNVRKRFNVIYLFHTLRDKDADGNPVYDLICEGSTKQTVWIPVDLGAYLQIINGERTLCFTPTASFSAKSAYGIKGRRIVPELTNGEPNDFLTKLFAEVRENQRKESEQFAGQHTEYEAAMDAGVKVIDTIKGIDDIDAARTALRAIKHALTSEKELGAKLKEKLAALNIVWNKDTKAYEQK